MLAFGGVPGAPEMTQEEIAAVVQVAHAVDKKVAAHAHGAESIQMAIAAGVDTIEHASYLDDACIAPRSNAAAWPSRWTSTTATTSTPKAGA